jgi:hypothetical protein
MKTVCASARYHQLISVILCCIGLQQIAQAQQFAPAVNYPTGVYPQNVAVGDFNQDGIPDLVVANFGCTPSLNGCQGGTGTVSILLGNGDGTFRPSREYGAGGVGTLSVAVGDFNGDGRPDLLVVNGTDQFGVLLGNGDGTFSPVVLYNSNSNLNSLDSVAVADLNGDGKLDFIATGAVDGTPAGVFVFLGNGDGTFKDAGAYFTLAEFGASGAIIVDLNGDGKPDLALAADDRPGYLAVLLGNGDGTFQGPVNYPTPTVDAPVGITSGDFNGDGKMDLAISSDEAVHGLLSGVYVLMGNGDGTFQSPVFYPFGYLLNSIAVGDFNSDGKLDLIVSDANTADGMGGLNAIGVVYLMYGNGDGTFQTAAPYLAGVGPLGLAVADLKSDGLLDLAVTNYASNNVSVLLNAGQPCRAAPVIDHLRARPDALWPSGRLVDVFIHYEATSKCGGSPACTLAVGSNEPLTQKDYRIIDAHHLKLRAEVSDREDREDSDRGEREHSDELVYQIQVSCTDRRSNVAHGHTIVTVLEDHHEHRDEHHHEHRDEDHRKHHDLDPASDKEEDSGSGP